MALSSKVVVLTRTDAAAQDECHVECGELYECCFFRAMIFSRKKEIRAKKLRPPFRRSAVTTPCDT
jgi:hypothetical protein